MLADLPTAPWFRRVLVAGLVAGIVLLTFSVLQPFIVPLIWGAILAYVSWPLQQRMIRWMGGRVGVASLATTLLVTTALVVPLVWLILMLRIEAISAYATVQAFLASKPTLPPAVLELPWVGQVLHDALQQLSSDPKVIGQQFMLAMEQSQVEITRLIGGVGRNVAKLFFAVLSMFFLLRDGPRLLNEARSILEGILGPTVRDYLEAVGSTTQAVVYALILGALAQGAVAGIGYFIFGIKAPVLMGAVTVLIALIPFGAPVVWGTMSIWLIVSGHVWPGVGLMLWGLLLVSWVDNIVRPLVISNATRMPFLLVVFGVLGGVLAFGLVGLFIGPVLLAVSLALWREWLEQHQQPVDG
ncbi:AI-2E family transporter [Povalibacter sp.]|uniref:AI-2E family transporter n=1 Tax=Povalibacter sp. TaxID=1962978 RepID=UPI002F41DAA6